VTGLLLLRGDRILVERYQYARTSAHRMNSMSMAKTVVAMLVGIAVAEGRILSLDDRAEAYVPEMRGTRYGTTPIIHLLSMTSGVRFSEQYSGKDDVAQLASLSLAGGSAGGAETLKPFFTREQLPGDRFSYSSGDSQALGLVLRAAIGRPLAEYLSEKIWQPMGAEADASWLVDKGGYELGYAGLNATLRDYGRFGLLLANDGAVGDRQVIPAEWVRAATVPSVPSLDALRGGPFFGYGYQTWLLPGRARQFALRGIFQQWILVDPRSRTVLVQTAVGEISTPPGELLELWRTAVEESGK
jgi:CubicO group peptidase (beta-lactamase class C family)